MFKENFTRLCIARGESPSFVCEKIGLSNSVYSQWKDTTIPRRATLIKLADYFNVAVEDLLQDDPALQQQKKPALNEDEPIDEVRRKLHAIIDTLSESDKEAMLFMAQSLMQRGK